MQYALAVVSTGWKRWLGRREDDGAAASLEGAAPAVVIGAVGGSGTRLIVQIAQTAGFFVGRDLNRSLDSVPGTEFLRSRLPRLLRAEAEPLRDDERAQVRTELIEALVRHRAGIARADAPWLIKNPRWSHVLPLLDAVLPTHRFVHVVRDGRDMAFSRNQGQVRDLGDLILGADDGTTPPPVRSATFWARQNLHLADIAENRLGNARYLRLRFEDLCSHPEPKIARLLQFLGTNADGDASAAAHLVEPPASIGRWREQEPSLAAAVADAARPALARMGYGER